MKNNNKKDPDYLEYYTKEDYDEVLERLPFILKEISKKSAELVVPTLAEKNKVMQIIKNFIKKNERKVYGGTAINENIKIKNPSDAIYNDYTFSDIEFYTPTPKKDMIYILNKIYKEGFQYPIGYDAQHEETYSIFVNFQLYCDITYVPTYVYHGIQTVEINGIRYAHPHFILIDQLRIINQPLTAAEQRWEKTFVRMYKLFKYYPLPYYNDKIKLGNIRTEIKGYISRIKTEFACEKENQKECLISGFEAYNFFIRHSLSVIIKKKNDLQKKKEQQEFEKLSKKEEYMEQKLIEVPYMELVSINYKNTIEKSFNYLKSIVVDSKKLTAKEYFPLFQFTGRVTHFEYDKQLILVIYQADGFCIPNISTTKHYMYVSFQYLLMYLLINKFRFHLNKDKPMYFNMSIMIGNLIYARNEYLNYCDIGVINDTIFSDFRISCVGETTGFLRASKLRFIENMKNKKHPQFRYNPEQFLSQPKESQEKLVLDNLDKKYKNSSGNIINPKKMTFIIDENGFMKINRDEILEEEEDEPQRIVSDTENEILMEE